MWYTNVVTKVSFVLSQSTRLSDRQTDRQTDGRMGRQKGLAIPRVACHAVARYKMTLHVTQCCSFCYKAAPVKNKFGLKFYLSELIFYFASKHLCVSAFITPCHKLHETFTTRLMRCIWCNWMDACDANKPLSVHASICQSELSGGNEVISVSDQPSQIADRCDHLRSIALDLRSSL